MPMRGEISEGAAVTRGRSQFPESTKDLISDLTENPDFVVVCAFAFFGAFVSLYLAKLFPLMEESIALLGYLS